MTKYLCITMLLFFSTICIMSSNANIAYVLERENIDYELLDCNENSMLIKTNDYKNMINKLNVEIVSIKEIEDRLIIEGYTNKLNNNVIVNDRKVNIQFSITDSSALVGYPLIYNSF